MSTPSSSLIFAAWCFPALVLAVLWHEAGHCVGAILVRRRLMAWGLGVRKPWFRARLGNSVFYVGRPLTSGLTLVAPEEIGRQPKTEFVYILFGPLASWVGLVAGIALWQFGLASGALAAWIAASGVCVAVTTIPFRGKTGGLELDNDARLLIDILRHGRAMRIASYGAGLSSCLAIAELLDDMGHRDGAGLMQLYAGTVQAVLSDFDAATENIASGETARAEIIPVVPSLTVYARAVLAVERGDDDAEQRLDAAKQMCADNDTAEFVLDALRVQWRFGRGHDERDAVAALRARELKTPRKDWAYTVDSLSFLVEPGEDDLARCRDLFHRHEGYIPDGERARLLAVTVERLVERGEHAQARALFPEAQQTLREAAAQIGEPKTRAAFLRQAAEPLRRASAATPENEVPLFVSESPSPGPPPTHHVATAAEWLGIATLVGASAGLANTNFQVLPIDRATADMWSGLIVLGWFSTLLAALLAMARRERRFRRLAAAALLATLGFAAAMTGGITHRPPTPDVRMLPD